MRAIVRIREGESQLVSVASCDSAHCGQPCAKVGSKPIDARISVSALQESVESFFRMAGLFEEDSIHESIEAAAATMPHGLAVGLQFHKVIERCAVIPSADGDL